MSGTIFPVALDAAEQLETTKWNPLQCNICTEQYREPCLLRCYHSFCSKCVESNVEDGKLPCPVCSTVTMVKEGFTAPPPDMFLKFLVESSTGDKLLCANCDRTESQMFFCNTCCQPLCTTCREDTHRAKMFQSHEIVPQTKHTKDIQKQCKVHGEPYILFSTEKKLMLCINCFRDMKVESRSHCVDLETAYKQGCQKLDDMMQSIRDLQSSVRDGILLLRALLEDVAINAEKEKTDITELYNTMQEKITETKESLLKEIERQYAEKEELFKNQLVSLVTFLPTLHVHLVTCGAFSSSADKFEFLDFTHSLTKRLTAIIQIQQPLHPSETSDIITDYKAMFAKCLEPLLFPKRNGPTTTTPVSMATSVASIRYEPSPAINSIAQSKMEMSESAHSQLVGNKYSHKKTKQFKMKLMETKGFFSDHCKEFDEAHRVLMQKVEGLKLSVQELQRDITLRRSLTKDGFIARIKEQIAQAEEDLEKHHNCVESKQAGLEQHWEESLERIAGEQEVYQAQLQDVGRLKMEVVSVNTILQKLSSFVSSIANVTQRLAPKLGQAASVIEQDGQHAALLQTISTMQPDSQQRVDAIRTAQEERDIKTANRVNPLDEELIKTKGLLRTPSARKSSTNRASMEIQEAIAAEAEREREHEKKKADNEGRPPDSNESDGNIVTNVVSVDVELTLSADGTDADVRKIDDITDCGLENISQTKDGVSSEPCVEKHEGNKLVNGKESLELDSVGDNFANTRDDFLKNSAVSDLKSNERGISSIAVNKLALPDLTKELNGFGSEHSESSNDDQYLKDSTGFTIDIEDVDGYASLQNSETDLDTSVETSISSDESFKQGHVREIVAKVDGRKMGECSPESLKDVSPHINEDVDSGNTNGVYLGQCKATGDRAVTNKKSCQDKQITKEIKFDEAANDNAVTDKRDGKDKTNSAETKVDEASLNDVCYVKSSADNDGAMDTGSDTPEDFYVAKSLPELAQVFEPGELKPKKRRSKNDRNKDK